MMKVRSKIETEHKTRREVRLYQIIPVIKFSAKVSRAGSYNLRTFPYALYGLIPKLIIMHNFAYACVLHTGRKYPHTCCNAIYRFGFTG